ncbi:cysteine--tRNA ligase [Candidatus Nomurabacteria bacterium]|nr:cysteine--tRNA ligase [Candidatus Nomurabacteria bacterium]
MALELYNSLSHKKELFEPLDPNQVSLYTCGPTVYNYPHIGNYRAYVFVDTLKRYLKHEKYNVLHVMNITDVDDKIIRDSQIQGKTLHEFTEFYTEAFYKDIEMLNIMKADIYTKATDYIPQMLSMIETLIKKGYAYKAEDNSVYFDIHKDKEYGKLSQINVSELKNNADGRLIKDEYEKENAQDFALWKSWTESDGDIFWETSLGKGRPGWHIECSAMSIDKLGESIDIHTGGVDLIFPHHENEIAQSECSTGKDFVKYWMHNEHLLVDGAKMSKSVGNFYTLRNLIEKDISPLAFRYWLYTGHYRTRVNFTIEAVIGSSKALTRLYDAYKALGDVIGTVNTQYAQQLKDAMDDDLNTSKGIALIWELLKDNNLTPEDKKATLLDFDNVFGFNLSNLKELDIPEDVKQLAENRETARLNKDWNKSDEIRMKIQELGYEVKDTESGPVISKL